jgi:polyferredoxin
LSLLSTGRDIPALLKSQSLRLATLIALMSLMIFRLSQNIGSLPHWGYVFWQMCLATTILAVALGLRYAPRSWCSFCPVGTMSSSFGGKNFPLQIHSSCKTCGVCEKSCPMQLDITSYKNSGTLGEKDCLKCSACITACPRGGVLSWPDRKAA